MPVFMPLSKVISLRVAMILLLSASVA